MENFIKIADFIELENQLHSEEITYSRMVEIINERAQIHYSGVISLLEHAKKQAQNTHKQQIDRISELEGKLKAINVEVKNLRGIQPWIQDAQMTEHVTNTLAKLTELLK